MKMIAMLASVLFIAGSVMAAGDIVLGNGNATLTYTPGGGANMVVSWAAPSMPPNAWSPAWAISMGLTNRTEYTDTGLYVQKGWQVNMLVNLRSNAVLNRITGVGLANSTYRIAQLTDNTIKFYYGNIGPIGANVASPGWYYISMVSTGVTSCILYTNGAVAASWAGTATFNTNTTSTFQLGTYNAGANGLTWDVARAQFIDPNGVLKLDLIATPYGYFTNVLNGVGYSYGVNGQGGTSLDSTNVLGLKIPAQTWK